MVVLGLDASSTTVGWAYTENGTIKDAGFIDISGVKGNREKAHFVVDEIRKTPLSKDMARINLEGSLSGFSGPSSRVIIFMLARWNAVLEYVLQDSFKIPVNLINVSTARKKVLGAARVKGMKPKEFVKIKMESLYDLTQWEIKNKKGNVDKRIEDVRDAVIMSLYA